MIFAYNPEFYSYEDMNYYYIFNQKLYNDILLHITSEKNSQKANHLLISGGAGYGKTMLLLRLYMEFRNNSDQAYKTEIYKRAVGGGEAVSAISREVGISENTLYGFLAGVNYVNFIFFEHRK